MLGISVSNLRVGGFRGKGIDADATTIYNRIIADGGVSDLTRLNFFVKGLKAIYGSLTNVPVCYDAHWIGYKLGSGTGATAGQAVAKLYTISVIQTVSDSDAQAFIYRVYNAGGELTNTEASAVNQLTIDMKAAGVWTSMKAVYPMVGASAAACAQNLKSSSFTGTFAGGWTFASTGATPNGTSAYMNTFLTPSVTLAANNIHLSYYSRTDSAIASSSTIGGDSSSEYCRLIVRRSANLGFTIIGNLTKGLSQFTVTDSRGLFIANAPNISTRSFYKNGTLITPLSQAALGTNGLSTVQIYLSALNNNNISAIEYDNKECSLSTIGDGLTDTQASDFYTSVQAFQTTLSRQV